MNSHRRNIHIWPPPYHYFATIVLTQKRRNFPDLLSALAKLCSSSTKLIFNLSDPNWQIVSWKDMAPSLHLEIQSTYSNIISARLMSQMSWRKFLKLWISISGIAVYISRPETRKVWLWNLFSLKWKMCHTCNEEIINHKTEILQHYFIIFFI